MYYTEDFTVKHYYKHCPIEFTLFSFVLCYA